MDEPVRAARRRWTLPRGGRRRDRAALHPRAQVVDPHHDLATDLEPSQLPALDGVQRRLATGWRGFHGDQLGLARGVEARVAQGLFDGGPDEGPRGLREDHQDTVEVEGDRLAAGGRRLARWGRCQGGAGPPVASHAPTLSRGEGRPPPSSGAFNVQERCRFGRSTRNPSGLASAAVSGRGAFGRSIRPASVGGTRIRARACARTRIAGLTKFLTTRAGGGTRAEGVPV